MSMLIRDNGTQFVIGAYRQRIKNKKHAKLKEQIRDIAEQQGEFIRIYKPSSYEYEVAFSHEPGFLLSESVKQYFQQTKNLIFCEAFDESKQLLLIVIKEGDVFIDAIITPNELKNKLIPLTTLKTQFQIVISGNIQLESNKQPFCFPDNLTRSLEKINEPLLKRLPSVPHARLLPLSHALKAGHIQNDSLINTGIILSLFICTLITLLIYTANQDHKKTQITEATNQQGIYVDYYTALKNNAPVKSLHQSITILEKIVALPGWEFVNLSQQKNQIHIQLISSGGKLNTLNLWAKSNNFLVHIGPKGIHLEGSIDVKRNKQIAPIYPLETSTKNLIDNLENIIANSHVHLLNTEPHQQSRERKLLLYMQDVSPQELTYLEQLLARLPVVLHNLQLSINKESLLNGSIQLSVWGK